MDSTPTTAITPAVAKNAALEMPCIFWNDAFDFSPAAVASAAILLASAAVSLNAAMASEFLALISISSGGSSDKGTPYMTYLFQFAAMMPGNFSCNFSAAGPMYG